MYVLGKHREKQIDVRKTQGHKLETERTAKGRLQQIKVRKREKASWDGIISEMPYVLLIKCDDEVTSWQRASSSVESQCIRGLANTNELTMSERFAVSKRPAGSVGLASDDSSDSRVAFTMNSSQEVGNVCARDTTSSSQSSVSKRTPERHNYSYNFLSQGHRNTNATIYLLFVYLHFLSVYRKFYFLPFQTI